MPKQKDQNVSAATKWIDSILKASIMQRASDIHIEPQGKEMVARFRIDGVMRRINSQNIEYHDSVISRLKVLANLNTVEKNIPQDGHIEVILNLSDIHEDGQVNQMNERLFHFRISVMPTVEGEAVVLRALNREDSVMSLEELGFSPQSLETVKKILQSSPGMFLVTGPNGSGKTTALYSMLNLYDVEERNIITLEDPVEYKFRAFRQTQIAPERGLTFAVGVKAILRQDPDIIMVGEIRDNETAEIAVSAALSGRLVFSTFHSSDIDGVIIRMMDMGIGKSMVASALSGIVTQRLVRKICNHCKVETHTPDHLLKMLGLSWEGGKVHKGKGCEECGGTGYFGRIGIFEVLAVDDRIKNLILERVSADKLRSHVRQEISQTLVEDGFEKVKKGITTIEEVLRVAV